MVMMRLWLELLGNPGLNRMIVEGSDVRMTDCVIGTRNIDDEVNQTGYQFGEASLITALAKVVPFRG
jgi:hypothetical protein